MQWEAQVPGSSTFSRCQIILHSIWDRRKDSANIIYKIVLKDNLSSFKKKTNSNSINIS